MSVGDVSGCRDTDVSGVDTVVSGADTTMWWCSCVGC